MPDLTFDLNDTFHNQFVAEFEVEHEDVFHLKNLYKLVYEWMGLYGFESLEGDDKVETLYFEKILGNGNSEHHVWWRLQHIPDSSQYYKYYLKFDFQTLNMGKSEVSYRGKKMSTNKGDLILRCSAYLMLDYKKEWREHPILSLFENFFVTRIYKRQIEQLKGDLWIKTYKLQDVIKQYLNLKTSSQMPEPFHNVGGL